MEAISETVSEKRGRGRPRRFSDKEMQNLRSLFTPDKRTDRHLQNFSYQARAQGVIEPLQTTYPELRWLYDHDAIWRGDGTYRQTIVQALGRIDDDRTLIAVARRICELKPTARKALSMIHRFRKVQKPVDLTNALRRTLNGYLRAYPEVTLAQARDALADLQRMIDNQLE